MAKQTVDLGTSLNSGDGDPLRIAFDKINDNFDELYARDLGTDPGNIGTNLAPSVNGGSDLGTTPQRWGTVFVRDFIDIGNGSTITVNADGEFVFNKPIISTVAVKNDIVGSIFADDSSIAFNAQTNTFFGKLDGDVTGSVYADNSTILVDGVNGTISAANLTGALPALDGSALTGITTTTLGGQAASYYLDFANFTNTPTTIAGYGITDAFNGAFGSLTGTPTTLSGYGITDAYTQTQVDTAITNATSSIVIPSGSSQSIDVVAADSTLLVDSANGTLNATTLTGALPAINGSALTNVTTTFANITSTPTTLAGYGITDAASLAAPAFTGAVDFTGTTSVDFTGATVNGLTLTETDPIVGAITGLVKADGAGNISAAVAGTDYSTFDGAFGSLTGKPTTLAGYGITDAANTSATTTFTADVKFDQGVTESFATYNSVGGVVDMDCDHGHLFYVTNATNDITTNFTNFGLTAEYGTNLTVIINQGATPYEVTAVQIGGAAQTINWQGGSAPTGNANGIDSFSFTILNDGGSYVVLGQMVDFT